MPSYLALLAMLALLLTPAFVARAEEPPSAAPAPPAVMAAPPPATAPADYPEDFSHPEEMAAARGNRYEAFGEDETYEEQPPAPALDKPLE